MMDPREVWLSMGSPGARESMPSAWYIRLTALQGARRRHANVLPRTSGLEVDAIRFPHPPLGYAGAPMAALEPRLPEPSTAGLGATPRIIDVEPIKRPLRTIDPSPRRVETRRPGPKLRMLFSPPGRRVDIRWSDFREQVWTQLEDPDRLSDDHRLPANLQVFEVRVPVEREALEQRTNGRPVALLTAESAATLGLGRLGSAPRPPALHEQPSTLLPGERWFSLRILQDPTAEPHRSERSESGSAPPLKPDYPTATAKQAAATPHQAVGPTPGFGRAMPTDLDTTNETNELIPSRFRAPWEFRRTREEVLYDIRTRHGLGARIGGALRSARQRPGRTGRMRRWEALLIGKSPEEQLWGVRPPRHELDDADVLDWAERLLAALGHEPSTALDEWEIFWRRKEV